MPQGDRFDGGTYNGHTFRAYEFPEGARGLVRVLCACGQVNLSINYQPGQPIVVLPPTS